MKYKSLIPKQPKALSSYNLFLKEKYTAIAEQYPHLSRPDLHKKCAENWKSLSEHEQQYYKDKAEQDRIRLKAEWESESGIREENRKIWCEKFGLPKSSSWEAIDNHNLKIWNAKYKSSSSKEKDIGSSESDSDDDNEDDGAPSDPKSNKRTKRRATENALANIKRLNETLLDDEESGRSNSEEEGDGEHRSMKKLKMKSSTKTLASGGLLSGAGSMMGFATSNSKKSSQISSSSSSSALKKRNSRIGDPEWETALWAEDRVKAVKLAIDR
jgi:hypothetical protein